MTQRGYTYFGKILTNNNELRPEIKKKITHANRTHYALLPLLKSQSVIRAENVRIYKAVTKPEASNIWSRIVDFK